MKSVIILTLIIVFAAGCISTPVPTGNSSQYEFPGLNNTTIFFLNASYIQVIDSVADKSSIDVLIDSISTFRYPVAVDYSGNNASSNVSTVTILGKNYAHFNFSNNFSGFIGYTIPGSMDFSYVPASNKTIEMVLPRNYTTGYFFPGYIQPKPDNITHDSRGREVLTWSNVTRETIRVRYYEEDTPRILVYIFGILLMCAFIVWAYYRYSISALERKRQILEKGIKK